MYAERLAELAVHLGFDGWLIYISSSLCTYKVSILEPYVQLQISLNFLALTTAGCLFFLHFCSLLYNVRNKMVAGLVFSTFLLFCGLQVLFIYFILHLASGISLLLSRQRDSLLSTP
ncbi:unnamed protein product [Trifolium pratense]|uniref:Uncharacterized protein n=1 Tax=Trifolium pratense TaxID=57577 RepID=A0ACB0LY46_TRIPR|nr:unnamed protein product [Trifolium pratense]